jgi:magnesium-transporting ATPase (P-type)
MVRQLGTSNMVSTTPNQEPRTIGATQWHTLEVDATLAQLTTTEDGLSSPEVSKRQAEFGPNVIEKKGGVSIAQLIWGQINSPLIWILIASAGIAIAVDPKDGLKNGLVILAVVILNTIIGFLQEYKASKAIAALSDMVPEFTTVIREGKRSQIAVAELVPGDMVFIQSGDKVPADMRLVNIKNLQIEEAALTGESVPSEKYIAPVAANAGLGDRKNMAFSGALVTYGAGTGVVTTTGENTELGRINTMLAEATEVETPLSVALNKIGMILSVGIGVVALLMIAVGTWRAMGEGKAMATGIQESVIFAITLAVGAIPEGLPAIVTIALAIGVQRMAARRAVVRKLPSVETLGSTTVICSDKTGTLTKNEMTVQALWTQGSGAFEVEGVGYDPVGGFKQDDREITTIPDDVQDLLVAGSLCNDSTIERVDGRWTLTGDPTEGALVVAARKVGKEEHNLRKEYARIDTIPFESANQYMATLHNFPGGKMIILKGAPEVLVKKCDNVSLEEVTAQVDRMAAQGMRVLGVAMKPFDAESIEMQDTEGGFSFSGLEGMIDPPRLEVIDSIKTCHAAGITVKMITGDHKGTAQAIGQQLGIVEPGQKAVTGIELAEMTDAQLQDVVKTSNVFARVAPEHKLRLVRALQANGEIAAMTGDGVNDAPALKQSNIGVAMGITGTSVSKEAADIVLTDDNFSSIAAAVEEGRRVYDNLIKSLAFVLPTNMGLAMILICAVAAFPFKNGELLLPLLPTQILWINLVGAVALALPLAFESKEPDVMSRKPRDPKEPVLNGFVVFRTFLAAILMTVGAVGMFLYEYYQELPKVAAGAMTEAALIAEAQTMAVTTVIMFQIFYMLNCRSLRDTVFKIGLFSNKAVFYGIGALLVLQAAFIYAPPLNQVFTSAPLDGTALLYSTLAGAIILPVISVEKWYRSRFRPA